MKKQNVRKAYQLSLEAELSFLWNIGLSGLKWLGTKGWKSQVLKWSQVSKWQLRFGNERKQNLSSIFSSGNKLKCLGGGSLSVPSLSNQLSANVRAHSLSHSLINFLSNKSESYLKYCEKKLSLLFVISRME